MKRMKMFFKYFINFIVLVLIVSGLMYLGTMNINKGNKQNNENIENNEIQYSVQDESPVIEIEECTNNRITGTIINDSKMLINKIYIKAECYNQEKNLLGTEYFEIKYFNVGEKARFEINIPYEKVDRIQLSSAETKE